MPVLHDMVCSHCGLEFLDLPLAAENARCSCGDGRFEILWRARHHHDAAVHASERAALYYSPKEKKFSYPGRNDQPIPDRLKRRGYERVEFASLNSIEQHEKRAGVRSERAWFDKGSGRSFDEG